MSEPLTLFESQLIDSIDSDEVVKLLQALIQQRSDYPPGDCTGVMSVLAEKLKDAGVNTQVVSRKSHQPNLLADYPADKNSHCLIFHAHADTVPAGDEDRWHHSPFRGEIQNGRVYGRGAGDDKASVVAQVMSLITLARNKVKLAGKLQMAVVADEESGGLQGTRWLRDEGLIQGDALIVGEQTENQIAIAERVACGIDLLVYGKSAHGAMPWAGENAVLKAAGAVTWLRNNLFPKLEERKHPYLPPPTLNLGKISGGIQWSIVPEFCKVEFDRRLLPGESREMAMDEIRQSLAEYQRKVEPLTYDLYSAGDVAPNINTPPEDPLVEIAQSTLTAITGENRPLTGYVQTSDGRWFAGDDMPIILFGPGDPSVAHSTDEFVTITELVEATRFLTLMAWRWLKEDRPKILIESQT